LFFSPNNELWNEKLLIYDDEKSKKKEHFNGLLEQFF